MSYIGNEPTSVAFLTDTFSGNGSTTAFTMSVAPATTSSVLVAITGVLQDPSTYSVSGTTLTFSAAPPSGTSNISVRYLGIPASGVTTTAYRTVTEFTATAGQTSFSVPSYTVGYVDVYRNGVMLGSADYTATTGTTIVLASGATAGDLVEVISFYVSSVLNAIPGTAGSVGTTYLADASVTKAKMASNGAWAPTGTVLQVVQGSYATYASTSSTSLVSTGLTASITPSSATSKILVLVNPSIAISYGSANTATIILQITRSGTQVFYQERALALNAGLGSGSIIYTSASVGLSVLDSPATTSSITYTLNYAVNNASVSARINDYNTGVSVVGSTITLMEIAA